MTLMNRPSLLLALCVAACSPSSDAPETEPQGSTLESAAPLCNAVIELGQMEPYQTLPIPEALPLEETIDAILRAPELAAAETLAINKTAVGQCTIHLAHAKYGSGAGPALETIRTLLVEPAEDDRPAFAVVAGERSLCAETPQDGWQPGACDPA